MSETILRDGTYVLFQDRTAGMTRTATLTVQGDTRTLRLIENGAVLEERDLELAILDILVMSAARDAVFAHTPAQGGVQ